jgi:hypothetical protein
MVAVVQVAAQRGPGCAATVAATVITVATSATRVLIRFSPPVVSIHLVR